LSIFVVKDKSDLFDQMSSDVRTMKNEVTLVNPENKDGQSNNFNKYQKQEKISE